MKISIITVVHNNVHTILQCIHSVVNQDYADIEYIVIDGDSTDGTKAILEKHSDKIDVLVSEPDDGIYDAMNKGIRIAKGEIIGILNSDDFYPSTDVISKIASVFQNAGNQALYGDLIYVDKQDIEITRRYWEGGQIESFLKGWHPPHPTFFVRKSVYDKYGLYDISLDISADFEMMFRLIEKEKIEIAYIPEVLVHMRMGGASNGSLRNLWRAFFQIKKSFRMNGYKYPFSYPFIRYSSKIQQFLRSKLKSNPQALSG